MKTYETTHGITSGQYTESFSLRPDSDWRLLKNVGDIIEILSEEWIWIWYMLL